MDVIQLCKLQIRFWLSDHCVFLETEKNITNTILGLVKIITIMFSRIKAFLVMIGFILLNINFSNNANVLQDNIIHHFYS